MWRAIAPVLTFAKKIGYMLTMRTAREIIAAIGSERFQQMLDIGDKSVSRAEAVNGFTARWWRAIDAELKENGLPGISEEEMDLFSYKDRIPIPPHTISSP